LRVPENADKERKRSSPHPIWILPPIAAAVIGGVPTTGGIDNLVGAIRGASIIGVVKNIIVFSAFHPIGNL
jgi:ribose/xylose/arabinose/galactoside ABC-type transport system permease subunit